MVATTVTPLIVRVVFLRRSGSRILLSSGVSLLMMSALEGTFSRWYLPAVLILSLFTSLRVGDCMESRVWMISRRATVYVKGRYQNYCWGLVIDKLS
jgi:hypothetical protein